MTTAAPACPHPAPPGGVARTVGELMRPGIVTCARSATVAEIARIMEASGTDCVVILTNGQDGSRGPVAWGLVTREDLARPLAESDPLATAEELARTPIVRAHVDLGIAEAQSLLSAMGVSHLVVADSAHEIPLAVVSERELTFPPHQTHSAEKGNRHV